MTRPTIASRPGRTAALVLAAASFLAACGGGTDAGTTLAGVTPSPTTVATTTGAGTPTTAPAAVTTAPATTAKPAAAPTTVVPTTTKKPGPTAAEVADLERQLDEIDKALADIQAELDTN